MINNNVASKHTEYLRKKRNKKIFRFTLGFLSVFVFMALVSFVAHRDFIRIKTLSVSGLKVTNEDEIKKDSFSYMAGSYFWLFPKNNIFLYPKDSLEQSLKENYKRIESVEIGFKNLNTIDIKFVEREPVGTWCDNGSSEEKCYFIDRTGFIFDDALEFSGNVYFKFYGFVPNDPVGSQYAEEKVFNELISFIEETKLLSLDPKFLIAKEQGEFSLVLSNNTEILFDTKKPLVETFDNLKALLSAPELSKMDRKNLNLEYIDLRFGNKLFYKLKNQ